MLGGKVLTGELYSMEKQIIALVTKYQAKRRETQRYYNEEHGDYMSDAQCLNKIRLLNEVIDDLLCLEIKEEK